MQEANITNQKNAFKQRLLHVFITACAFACATSILAQEVPQSSTQLNPPVLTTPIVTAVTEDRRKRIKVSWGHVPNAQIYIVKLIIHNGFLSSPTLKRKDVLAPNTTTTEDSIDILSRHYDAYVTATAAGYSNSEEVLATVYPRKLSSDSFNLNAGLNSLSLDWNAEDGTDFYDKTKESYLFFSIVDMGGNLVGNESRASTITQTHDFSGLSRATEYKLKITVGFTANGFIGHQEGPILLKGEALEISFNTLEALPEPTGRQISSTVEGTTLIVNWDNAAEGVTNYDLTLVTTKGAVIGTPKEVNALMAGSTTFTSLNAGTTYRLSVVAKGDASVYSPSPPFTITTNPLLSAPGNVTAAIEARREITVTVTDIRVAWDPVENAEDYTVTLLSADSRTLRTIVVPAPATGIVLENHLFNQFFTVSVTATADTFNDSEEVSVFVLPPKLLSEFFTVIASDTAVSLLWDSAFDDSLQSGGVSFYDATYIGNLGSSATSGLFINIEDDEGNGITGPEEVSTRAAVYSTGGLSEATNYVLQIAQGVRIGDVTRSSEVLEIEFRTLEVLPEPESLQITTSIVDSNNLLVGWDNAAEGVTNYDLTLTTGEGTVIGTPKEVNALMAGSTIFIGLDLGTAYTLSVVAKGDASVYSPSPPYRVIVYQPQLETPAGFSVFPFEGGVTATGMPAEDIDRYIFKLYLGVGTSSTALDTRSIPNNSGDISASFLRLEPGTQYTVEIIARADNYRESNPRVVTVRTEKANINAPTESQLVITSSTDNITVTFENTQSGVDGYALSIHERFDDMGIAQSTEDSSIGESPITFTDLVPNGAYTLMALPIFNSERYEYTGGIVSLDFVVNASLRLRLRAFLEGPLQ